MTKKFHEDLNLLKIEVMNMGSLATCFLERGVEALVKQDVVLANKILDMRKQIFEMDRTIEGKALQLLTLHQPMAVDLRTIAAILKIITDLTRIGRYGKDIAGVVEELSQKPHVKKLVSIPLMLEIVLGMIIDALDAFNTGNLDKIGVQSMVDRDKKVDELRWSIFRECITYMMEDPQTITRCMHYVMISRYLERCGDHACLMAEKVHYIYSGVHLSIK